MLRSAAGTLVLCAVALNPAGAQVLDIVPEKILYKDMDVVDVGPFVSQPRPGTGVIWSKVIQHGSRPEAVRVHIQVRKSRPNADWRIRILNLAGTQVESVSGDPSLVAPTDFWSTVVPGRGAVVELETDTDATNLEIGIDQYAHRVTPAIPQGVIGVPNFVPIRSAALFVPFGGPIARLSFMKNRQQYVCTGFMVTRDLLLTNEHCLSTGDVARSALVDFGFDDLDTRLTAVRVSKLEAVSVPLDYALVRLRQAADAFGRVSLGNTAVAAGQQLAIIQHPAGEFKQVSFDEDCLVQSAAQQGVTATRTDFSHRCDTLGGSSGSPVLDRQTGKVVGLHHWGYAPGTTRPVNQGVHIGLVLADLQTRFPALSAEINAAP